MEGKSLPFFGPSVEFSSVPPIEKTRILNYFNQFVSNTVQLLNKFAVTCDTKLLDLDFKLQELEGTLTILEAKLASIPSIEITTNITPTPVISSESSNTVQPSPVVIPISQAVEQHQTSSLPQVNVSNTQQEASVDPPSNPEILRFVKMLAFGVPLMAVQQKMRAEGYDPSLLHSNSGTGSNKQQTTHDSSNSDDDFDSSSNNE